MTGRLRFFHANWLNISRDQFILNAVQGFKICFRCTPVQSVVPRVSDQNSIIKNEIVSLLIKGAIRQVPFSHDGFCHRLFLVPKKGGGQRPVLDLSALNQFIETEHFKIENLVTLKSLLNKGDYMINLDLTDAYLTVPMHPDSRKFLRFLLGDKTYEFTAMPFGLNVAPRLFTKIMKPVVASLRSQGVRLIIYLDDILIIASSIETLNRHKTLAISLLESLGFLINYEKSNLTPSQQIVFLGMLVDSASMQFILPQQKAVQIQKECRLLLNTNRPTIRHLSRVLGLLEACRPAVWSAPLHYRQLQTLQINALQRWANFNAPVDLTPSAKSDLSWWVTTLQTPQGSPIVPPIADLTISSDASKQGWGASWGSQRTGGLWSEKESQDHINVLELRAAFFALKSFLPTQTNKVICLKLDNTTAVSYLNNLGGTYCPQLLHLAVAIWDWCEKRHLFLLAQHIPGKTNVEADTESRVKRDLNDWRIPPKIIAPLIRDCTIDLFASRLTPTKTVCQLETGSKRGAQRRLHDELVESEGICLPSVQLNSVSSSKGQEGTRDSGAGGTTMDHTTLVASTDRTYCGLPGISGEQPQTTARRVQSRSDAPSFSFSEVSRMENIRQRYKTMGISEKAIELLCNNTKGSTSKTYNVSWAQWSRWCSERKSDPVSCPVSDILTFLAEQFSQGKEYRSINVLRSAISSAHCHIDDKPVGQHPLIVRLMKGVSISRPPQPRYQKTWNVSVVTAHLASLGCNKTMSIKQLSQKLCMLMDLTCPERSSVMASLDITYMRLYPEGVKFFHTIFRRRAYSGNLGESVYPKFTDESLCPVTCLSVYLERTKDWRAINKDKPRLFLSIKKPHKPVSSSTLSRWIKETIFQSGIKDFSFTGHSVRSASTSAARASGLSIDTIISMADWTNESTFKKFYYSPSLPVTYGTTVLSNSS